MNASKFLVSSAAAIAIVGAVSFAYAQTDNQSTPMSNSTTAQAPVASPGTDTTTTQTAPANPVADATTAPTPAASPATDATTNNSMPNSGGDTAAMSTERPAKADRH